MVFLNHFNNKSDYYKTNYYLIIINNNVFNSNGIPAENE